MAADDWLDAKKKSGRNFWIGCISLVLVAIFVPERYSVLIFLGAICALLFEISDRLRNQYYLHQNTMESLVKLSKKLAPDEDL